MPVGLQTWDANGVLRLDVTTRLPKVLGRVYFPEFHLTSSGEVPASVNGSLSDERLALGRFFYFFSPSNNPKSFYDGWAALGPVVTLTGTRLSWNWDRDTVGAWMRASSVTSASEGAGDSYLNYGIF